MVVEVGLLEGSGLLEVLDGRELARQLHTEAISNLCPPSLFVCPLLDSSARARIAPRATVAR